MKAEIISIGDELLIGQVVNTNASWLGEKLSETGIQVVQVSVISDQHKHILSALKEASGRASLILITGGLGPTRDDITKDALCSYFNTKLVFNPEAFASIEALFANRGFPICASNRLQAEIPGNCRPIPNSQGTAPGMWFEQDGKIYVSMPGVPFEMKPMMTEYVLPDLQSRFTTSAIVHKTILTQGVGESMLAEIIRDWEDNLPAHIKLAYLPHPGIVRLRLSAHGTDKGILTDEVDTEISTLLTLIPDLIYGYDDDTLENIIGRLLLEKNGSLVTAESCTGGYLSHLITSVPGSSLYYKGSIIAYSNALKESLLKVAPVLLLEYGAVSEQVAGAMAENARQELNAEYAIAISGIAGPGGGTDDKPVGTTWIAVASPGQIKCKRFLLGEHRGRNIQKAAVFAMNMLRKQLITETFS